MIPGAVCSHCEIRAPDRRQSAILVRSMRPLFLEPLFRAPSSLLSWIWLGPGAPGAPQGRPSEGSLGVGAEASLGVGRDCMTSFARPSLEAPSSGRAQALWGFGLVLGDTLIEVRPEAVQTTHAVFAPSLVVARCQHRSRARCVAFAEVYLKRALALRYLHYSEDSRSRVEARRRRALDRPARLASATGCASRGAPR